METQTLQHIINNYYCDTTGNIYFLRKGKMYLKKNYLNKFGYLGNVFIINKKRVYKNQHTWIYQAYNGEIPKGMGINHIDHNKLNNSLKNLELLTPRQNNMHHLNWIGIDIYMVILTDLTSNEQILCKTHKEVQIALKLKYRQMVINIIKQDVYGKYKIDIKKIKIYKD